MSVIDGAARALFVRTETRPCRPDDAGGLALWLADDFTALWSRAQAWLADGNAPPPYWAHLWPGGLALARHLRGHPEVVVGRTVFDFATGSGLCALTAAALGARAVWACDLDPLALSAVAMNAEANGLRVEGVLGNPIEAEAGAGPTPAGSTASAAAAKCEVLLAGDVFYEAAPSPSIARWLQARAAAGARVLVGEPYRAHRPRDGFVVLDEVEIVTPSEVEGVACKRVSILELRAGG